MVDPNIALVIFGCLWTAFCVWSLFRAHKTKKIEFGFFWPKPVYAERDKGPAFYKVIVGIYIYMIVAAVSLVVTSLHAIFFGTSLSN